MQWHKTENKREMPWKGEKDPYKIWLSEIILQQTRVEQGLSYYLRFIEAYPNVNLLAKAPDAEVFKKWEGLGYYSRCRNLLFTARTIADMYHGTFPGEYKALLNLKGVGPYTAAAIASFAFGLPHAVVDGNVIRVLARFFNIEMQPDSPKAKRYFQDLAQAQLDADEPGAFNQAIMDFGATVCKPATPDCPNCPLASNCLAFQLGKTITLPLKKKSLVKRKRFFTYIILRHKGKIWVKERNGKDIWRHLEEFFLIELGSPEEFSEKNLNSTVKGMGWSISSIHFFSEKMFQVLTHQEINAAFILVDLKALPDLPKEGRWIPQKKLKEIAFPRIINHFLEKSGYSHPVLFDVWGK